MNTVLDDILKQRAIGLRGDIDHARRMLKLQPQNKRYWERTITILTHALNKDLTKLG